MRKKKEKHPGGSKGSSCQNRMEKLQVFFRYFQQEIISHVDKEKEEMDENSKLKERGEGKKKLNLSEILVFTAFWFEGY